MMLKLSPAFLLVVVVAAIRQLSVADAFTIGSISVTSRQQQIRQTILATTAPTTSFSGGLYATPPSPDEKLESKEAAEEEEEEGEERPKLEVFLEKKYKSFYNLIMKNNDEMIKAIKKGSVTIFVPNDAAFDSLGEKQRTQLEDPRNEEIKEKMGSYHVLPDAVSAIELRTEDWTKGRPKDGGKPNTLIAGIKTLSGEVPVGRSKSGGFLGLGATEDGDIVIGPSAKIVQSFNVEGSFVHEVDALISPQILWRYCDQLRIPGF